MSLTALSSHRQDAAKLAFNVTDICAVPVLRMGEKGPKYSKNLVLLKLLRKFTIIGN